MTPHMKPSARFVLDVLREHPEGVSAIAIKQGRFGQHIDAVSQRVTELKRLGYDIDGGGRGGHESAVYRLVSEPPFVPTIDDHAGALFAV